MDLDLAGHIPCYYCVLHLSIKLELACKVVSRIDLVIKPANKVR